MIKLWVPNLAAIEGGVLRFDDKLPLALFRTKANDVCEYLNKKNEVNQGVLVDDQRLSFIPIPLDQNSKLPKAVKDAVDTTRVRLCFQVKRRNIVIEKMTINLEITKKLTLIKLF